MLFLETHFIISLLLTALLGLAMGSFLNVVIIRYPVMLARSFRAECLQFLKLPAEAAPAQSALNLLMPGSHCPHCLRCLTWRENIPLFSYWQLRGRCAGCREKISIQYPIIEFLTLLATVTIFFHFAFSVQTLFAWLLTWGLIALAGIDWRVQLLPDVITLSLLWIGLLANTQALFTPIENAVWSAVIGYVLLWVVAFLFKKIRKKQGMGHGDFKMLAMFGAWLGLLSTLYVLLLAVLLGLIVNISLLLLKKIGRDHPLPFGPSLALAGWVGLLFFR